MRSSIDQLVKALKAEKPPKKIWQESFDYIGPVKYHNRLCHLEDRLPNAADLIDYSLDIQYMKIQPDLLRYLLPVCLKAWQIDLFSGERESVYGGFVEYFSTALAEKGGFAEILNKQEHQAVMEFMCDSILDVLDRNNGLHFSGQPISTASPYRWFQAIGTFAVVYPNVERLWSIWWRMETRGHAMGVLQYISTLMYEDSNNPIFDPWTREQGGGPPSLFETEGFIYYQSWRPENTSFQRIIFMRL
jgi:hypothetical protein